MDKLTLDAKQALIRGLDFSTLAETTQYNSSLSVQTVLAPKQSRKYISLVNNTDQVCYVLFGTGVVSSTLFSLILPVAATTNHYFVTGFKGVITVIFAGAGTGKLNVTEHL